MLNKVSAYRRTTDPINYKKLTGSVLDVQRRERANTYDSRFRHEVRFSMLICPSELIDDSEELMQRGKDIHYGRTGGCVAAYGELCNARH